MTPGARAPETPSAPGPRFRFGVGFVSGGTNLANAYPLPTVAGLETRLGVQINDTLAVMYQGSFTLYWPDLRDAVLLEITPTRSFSVGVGLGVDLVSGPIQSPIPNGNDLNLLGLVTTGIPIRLAWNVLASQAPGRRTAMALSLEVTPGLGSVGADSVGVTLSALGGISFEMY